MVVNVRVARFLSVPCFMSAKQGHGLHSTEGFVHMSTQILPKEVWTRTQRRTLFAGVGSWTLDAFDFWLSWFFV